MPVFSGPLCYTYVLLLASYVVALVTGQMQVNMKLRRVLLSLYPSKVCFRLEPDNNKTAEKKILSLCVWQKLIRLFVDGKGSSRRQSQPLKWPIHY